MRCLLFARLIVNYFCTEIVLKVKQKKNLLLRTPFLSEVKAFGFQQYFAVLVVVVVAVVL